MRVGGQNLSTLLLPAYFFSSVSPIMSFCCLGIYERPRDPIRLISTRIRLVWRSYLLTGPLYCCSFLMFLNMNIPIQSGSLYILPQPDTHTHNLKQYPHPSGVFFPSSYLSLYFPHLESNYKTKIRAFWEDSGHVFVLVPNRTSLMY